MDQCRFIGIQPNFWIQGTSKLVIIAKTRFRKFDPKTILSLPYIWVRESKKVPFKDLYSETCIS